MFYKYFLVLSNERKQALHNFGVLLKIILNYKIHVFKYFKPIINYKSTK